MNNEERINQLERQVQELLAWKTEKTRQQISFPLDEASKEVINENKFVWVGTIAENPPDPILGAMCMLNGKLWGVQIVSPSIYE